MALIAKEKNKAKYHISSVTPDGRDMFERCDNKAQLKDYLVKIIGEDRRDIWFGQRIIIPTIKVGKRTIKRS